LLRFWRRCGGGVAHGRRFQAALQLFRTSVSFFFLCFDLLFFFTSLSSLNLCFFPLLFFMFFSPLGFSLLSVLPLSLLCFFCFVLLLPPLSSLLSFSVFPPCSQRSWPLFIEAKDAVFYSSQWGAAGWSAIGRGCRGSVGGARWLVGHCVRSVGSRRESGRQKFKLKLPFLLLPRCVIGGRR